jgi:hypothetical protein
VHIVIVHNHVQNPLFHIDSAIQGMTLSNLCTAVSSAEDSHFELGGIVVDGDSAAASETSSMQLWRADKFYKINECDLWSWRSCGPMTRWTLSRDSWTVCNGRIHLPAGSQLWLDGAGLCFNNVEFSGVPSHLLE